MNTTLKLSLLGFLGAVSLAFAANTASAAVVCNEDGDCWHSHTEYTYPPEAGIVIHPDTWRWGTTEHHAWREHDGRGYWHGGEWRTF
jgi:hypothetical protein